VNCNPSTVFVTFDVQRFVNVTDSVKLEIINMPPKSRPWIEIDKVPCVLGIPESASGDFRIENAKAVLDLKGFKRGDIKLAPQIIGLPKYSRVVKVDSIRIHY